MRALAVVLAIVLGFAAVIVIAVMVDLAGGPICDDVAFTPLGPVEDCFDVSSTGRILALITGFAGGVLGVLATLTWVAVAFTGRRVKLAVQLSIAAVVLVAISLLVA